MEDLKKMPFEIIMPDLLISNLIMDSITGLHFNVRIALIQVYPGFLKVM